MVRLMISARVSHIELKNSVPLNKDENQESVKTLRGRIPTDPRLSQSD